MLRGRISASAATVTIAGAGAAVAGAVAAVGDAVARVGRSAVPIAELRHEFFEADQFVVALEEVEEGLRLFGIRLKEAGHRRNGGPRKGV